MKLHLSQYVDFDSTIFYFHKQYLQSNLIETPFHYLDEVIHYFTNQLNNYND